MPREPAAGKRSAATTANLGFAAKLWAADAVRNTMGFPVTWRKRSIWRAAMS